MNCLDFYDFRFYGFILWVDLRVGKSGTKYLRIYSKMFGPRFTYSGKLLFRVPAAPVSNSS